MLIRRVLSHEKVVANKGRIALERGPVVYCVEVVDNGGTVSQIALSEGAELGIDFQPELLGGVTVIEGDGNPLLCLGTQERGRCWPYRNERRTQV